MLYFLVLKIKGLPWDIIHLVKSIMKFSLNKQKSSNLLIGVLFVLLCGVIAALFGPKHASAIEISEFRVNIAQSTVYMSVEQFPVAKPRKLLQPTRAQVRAEIIYQANIHNVRVEDALRIAQCESGFLYNAKNNTSTAKGVYQFINGTWDWVGAKGHQFDYQENIRQFMIWYPKYPQWWECK